MNVFTADPRDAFLSNTGCNTCCCASAVARPGETNKFMINYAAWGLPLGGRGLTDRVEFSVERREQSPDSRAPVNPNKYFPAVFNTPLADTVATGASDPLDGTLTYKLDQLNGPERGEVVLNEDGSFTYTPTLGFTGYDIFFIVTSNEAKSVTSQVIVGVAAQAAEDPLPAKAFEKPLAVLQKSVVVDKQNFLLSFALKASPLAVVGDIYRVTIKQPAMDCNCIEYTHISCYDVNVVGC